MRGLDERRGSPFSYVDLEDRVLAKHRLRVIRLIVNDVLAMLDGEPAEIYADSGRRSISQSGCYGALLPRAFYTIPLRDAADGSSSTTTCCTAGLSGSGSTSRYGFRRCSRRTAKGCWMRRLRTSAWPNF